MNQESNHNDLMQQVEKVKMELAVLDSKSNRLHQDTKDMGVKLDEVIKIQNCIQLQQQKTTTMVWAVPSGLFLMYNLINIVKGSGIL